MELVMELRNRNLYEPSGDNDGAPMALLFKALDCELVGTFWR